MNRKFEDIVKHKVWLEALDKGTIVSIEAKNFGVIPHVYN